MSDEPLDELILLRDEPLDEAALAALHSRVMSAVRPGRVHLWHYAAAAVLLLMGGASLLWRPPEPALLPVVRVAVDTPRLLPVAAPAVVVPVRRVRKKVVEKREPIVVRMQTDDPDVVIYWIAD